MKTDYLRSPVAIRARSELIYKAGLANQLAHFSIDLGKLPLVVEKVAATIRASHPSLELPPFGRIQHFRTKLDRIEAAGSHALIDLVVISVLLGNGADAFDGSASGSLQAFEAGMFSSDPAQPLRVDLAGLRALDPNRLTALGFEKTGAVRALAESIARAPHLFADGRPSGILGVLGGAHEQPIAVVDHDATWPHRLIPSIDASAILRVVLEGMHSGDVGKHEIAGDVPLHHEAQWLAYSLFEPLERAGYTIAQAGALTGLPDERSGGLLVDLGVLVPKYMEVREISHHATDEVIVEWKALTIALLDQVAKGVRQALGRSSAQLPLHHLLDPIWMTGRAIAAQIRPGGGPPIRILPT